MAIIFSKKDIPYSHWQLIHIETGDHLCIVPERGGLITEWHCNGREILYFDLERFKQKGKSVRGGIPILFPICGNLPGNCLTLEQGNFLLNQHGFARDSTWQIKPIEDKNTFVLSLSDTLTTRAIYPYCFLVELEVQFEGNSLDFSIRVHNQSSHQMPFSFGMHPYFNVKDLKKTKIEGLPPTCIDHLNMIEGPTAYQLGRISEGIDFVSGPTKSVALIDLSTGTRLEIEHQEPMDLTVVWTDPPRPMICLEPWTSPRESLISGERRLILEPGAVQKLNCSFLVD